MFKKLTKIWKSIISDDDVITISPEEMEEGKNFVINCFNNKEYQALGRAYKADPIKYNIPQEYINIISKNFTTDFESHIFNSANIDFFALNPQLLSPEDFLNIFQLNLTPTFYNDIFRYHILAKNPDLIKLDKLTEKDFAIKRTCEFLIEKANSKEVQNHLVQRFSHFLKNGSDSPNEEILFCISSSPLASHFKLSDIQKSPHTTNRLTRTFFAEYRQLNEMSNSNKELVPKTAPTPTIKPFVLDDATVGQLPYSVRSKYNVIIEMVNKYNKSRIKNDQEDIHFLESLMQRHLPETISQYLQIDVSFRDKVFASTPKTATEIIHETLDLYINRLEKIGSNLSEAALNKLQAHKLHIQRMSQKITLFNQGVTEVPDELEIKAPEVEIPRVRLR